MTSEEQVAKKARVGDATGPGTKASAVLVPADEVVAFHLVTSGEAELLGKEIDAGGAEFNGEFFHQHFNVEGREEQIRGYIGLSIDIWVSARTMHMWLDIKYKTRKPGADKLDKIFGEFAPPGGFIRSREEFIAAVTKDAGSMQDLATLGTVVSTLNVGEQGDGQADIQIVKYNLAKCDAAVKGVHSRMEPLMLFFIDGANAVEADDEMWELLLALKPVPGGGNLVLGLQTVYKFWAFPDTHRLRLSQVLVLPPYQGIGIGKKFLQVAYKMATEMECKDLTVEDPSPNLQCVREKLECEMMQSMDWIMELIKKGASEAMHVGGSCPKKGGNPLSLSPTVAARITKELKITQKEVVLAWEALMHCCNGLMESTSGRETFEQLVRRRLEAAHFAHNAADAESKQVIPLGGIKQMDFIMFKWSAKGKENKENDAPAATSGAAAALGAAAPGTNGTAPANMSNCLLSAEDVDLDAPVTSMGDAIADAVIQAMKGGQAGQGEQSMGETSEGGGTVASGRLNVTTMTAEEKATRMTELLEERLSGLKTLKSLMSRSRAKA